MRTAPSLQPYTNNDTELIHSNYLVARCPLAQSKMQESVSITSHAFILRRLAAQTAAKKEKGWSYI